MNKHLLVVKNILDKKKTAAKAKLAQASLTPEQKTQLEDVMSQIDEAITALDAATAEATTEEISSIFAKAVETLSAITDQSVAQVQTDVQAECDQDQQGHRDRQPAIAMHGVKNPVERTQAPEDPGKIGEQEALPRRTRQQTRLIIQVPSLRNPRPQDGNDQRRGREPRQPVQVQKRKNDDLQSRREQDQTPGAEMDSPHTSA